MLHEADDGPAFAGGVSPLEDNDEPLPFFLHPALQFDELDLERELLPLVLLALHAHAVRVAAAPKRLGRDLARQNGIVDVETRNSSSGPTSSSSKLWDMFPRPPFGTDPPTISVEGTKAP